MTMRMIMRTVLLFRASSPVIVVVAANINATVAARSKSLGSLQWMSRETFLQRQAQSALVPSVSSTSGGVVVVVVGANATGGLLFFRVSWVIQCCCFVAKMFLQTSMQCFGFDNDLVQMDFGCGHDVTRYIGFFAAVRKRLSDPLNHSQNRLFFTVPANVQ